MAPGRHSGGGGPADQLNVGVLGLLIWRKTSIRLRQAALSWPLCHYIGGVPRPMDRPMSRVVVFVAHAKVLTLMESNWLVPTAMSAF